MGSFKSSTIESLYAEAHEALLNLRREKNWHYNIILNTNPAQMTLSIYLNTEICLLKNKMLSNILAFT